MLFASWFVSLSQFANIYNSSSYGSGLVIETIAEMENEEKSPAKKKSRNSSACICGATSHRRRNSLLCRLNPKNQMMCLPTTADREDTVLAENDRETCGEVNNVNTLNNISTEKYTRKDDTIKDEMRDSIAYVETIREKEEDSMDSDDSSIDVEVLLDDDDMALFSV